jgi:ribonuclease HI
MEIYTDSSYNEKNKVAGIGIHIINGVKSRQISNFIPVPNNNLGEMWAIYVAAIVSGYKPATIYTDSLTALGFLNGTIQKKTRTDFKTEEQWINHNQMRVLAYKIKRANPNLKFEKVKAHRKDFKLDHLNNSMADILAKKGVAKYLSR